MSNFIDEFNLQNQDYSSSKSLSLEQELLSSMEEHNSSGEDSPSEQILPQRDPSQENQDLSLQVNLNLRHADASPVLQLNSAQNQVDIEMSQRENQQPSQRADQVIALNFPPCVNEQLELSIQKDEEMFEDALNASFRCQQSKSPLQKEDENQLLPIQSSSGSPKQEIISEYHELECDQSMTEHKRQENQNQEHPHNNSQIVLEFDDRIQPDSQLRTKQDSGIENCQNESESESSIVELEEGSDQNRAIYQSESKLQRKSKVCNKADLNCLSKQNMKELKLSQKRRKLMDSAQQVAMDVANHNWEAVSRLSQGKVEPYQFYNVNFFWYLISSLFYNNNQDIKVFENIRKQSKASLKITEDQYQKQEPQKSLALFQTILHASQQMSNSSDAESLLQGLRILLSQNEEYLNEKMQNLCELSKQDLCQSFQPQQTQKLKADCFIDCYFLEKNSIAQDLIKVSQLEIEYFALERTRQAKNRIQHQEHPFPWRKDVLAITLRPNFDGCVICNSEEFDNDRLWCSLCENSVHITCVGEHENNVKHNWNRDENQLEVLWHCKICTVQNSVNQNIERNGTQLPEIEFRPDCFLCKLQGGIMLPTNCLNKQKARPVQFLNNKWASTITPNSSISDIIKKEADYQKCLNRLRHQNVDEVEMNSYSPTFVHWAHISCAFWLPQIQFQKGKPINLKSKLEKQMTPCYVCHQKQGLLIKCCYEKLNSDDNIYSQYLDYKTQVNSCSNMMHVECARRADFQMDYQHQVEKFQVFCYEHKPYQIDTERHQLFWERADSINTFVESYQSITRQHAELFKKASENETIVRKEWMEYELQLLATIVEQIYFKLPDVTETIRTGQAPLHITHKRFIDFRVILIESIFDWSIVANRLNYEKEECQVQYWLFLAKTRDLFKKKVLSKQNLALYKIIESATIQTQIQKNSNDESVQLSATAKKGYKRKILGETEGKRKSVRVLEKRKASQVEEKSQTSEDQLSQKREQKSNMKLLNRGGYRHVTDPETNFKPTLVKIYDSQFQPIQNSFQSTVLDKSTCCYCSCEPDKLKTPKRQSFQQGHLQQIALEKSKSNFSNESGDPNGLSLNFKTGLVRCGSGKECVKMLPQFHVSCCIVNDPSFREIKNAKRKWVCLYCLTRDTNKQLTDNQPVNPEDSSSQKADNFDMDNIKVTIHETQRQREYPSDYNVIDNELIEHSSYSSSDEQMQTDVNFFRSYPVEERELSNSRQPAGPASGQSTTFQASKTRRQMNNWQMQHEQQKLLQQTYESPQKQNEAATIPSEPRFLIRIPFEYFKDNEMLD